MAKSKAVAKIETETEVVTVDIIEEARKYFGSMQRSWWFFAKAVYTIRESKVYESEGHGSFKEFCSAEYPSIDYTVLIKYCSIVKEWGKSIESRLKKDDEYRLPAYESCYRVITAKDAPKEEVTKLKKGVLDGGLTYAALKDRLKEITDKVRTRIRDEVDHSVDDIEEQLTREIEGDLDDDYDTADFEPTDTFMDSADVEDFTDDEELVSTTALKTRVAYLNENLPNFANKVAASELTDAVTDFAGDLEKLYNTIDEILSKIEEKSSV